MVDMDMRQETERGLPMSGEEKVYHILRNPKVQPQANKNFRIDEGYDFNGMPIDYDTIESEDFCTGGKKQW